MTGRHYTIDGERYPSVTTILGTLDKPALALWRGRLGNEEADRQSKEAASWGTYVHSLIEQVNLGNRDTLDDVDCVIAAPYIEWFDANVSAVLGAERLCVSRRWKYAGTADGVVVLNGDHDATVIDLKTSKTGLAQREWELQLAAYSLALEEAGIIAPRRIILRMPRATPGKMVPPLELEQEELEIDQRCFLSVLRVFQWHASKKPASRNPPGLRITFRRQKCLTSA